MKKIVIALIIIFGTNAVNAANFHNSTNRHYRDTSTRTYNTNRTHEPYRNKNTYTRNTTQPKRKHYKEDNRSIRFYISAKGGYNLIYGMMYTDEDDNKGFTFSTGKPVFSGALGLDLNYSPPFRLELEIANTAASKVKFKGDWDSYLHADVGYTSYTFNFIPYFKATDTTTFNIILGLGAASIDFTDTDQDDFFYLQSGKTAFVAKMGLGFDIPLTDNFYILPEIQYNLLVTTVKYGYANIYIGYLESEAQTFVMHNCQFTLGAKYRF